MNKKLKVVTVVGTRPELIRLSRIFAALDNSPAINHILIHTGQNFDYELNEKQKITLKLTKTISTTHIFINYFLLYFPRSLSINDFILL